MAADIRRFAGLATRRRMLELGHSAGDVARAIHSGAIATPRRGWLCSTTAPAGALRAVELGGKLGGASALASHGIWVDDGPLIVSTAPTASRLPSLATNEHRVWINERFAAPGDFEWRVSVRDALLQHSLLVSRASLVASVDNALYLKKLRPSELASWLNELPRGLRGISRDIDGRAMSGTETKLRLACVAAGLVVELQESIANVGHVDLLIDGWLIVEVDSKKFHDGPSEQHRDRVRDGNSVLGNYGHLRFDYALVQYELEWCVRVILARLRQGV